MRSLISTDLDAILSLYLEFIMNQVMRIPAINPATAYNINSTRDDYCEPQN
jgi:hypothetical protein